MTAQAPPVRVPHADPGAGYRAQREEIDRAVARVLHSGWYVLGRECQAFEAAFASWLGARHAIGCGSGTDALVLALRAAGAGAGAAVATVSHTAVATVAAVELAGAEPLLLDILPDSYTLDPAELDAVLRRPPPGLPPIRAVIAVHLYGRAAEMHEIASLCDRHGVALIEDCAQAQGATIGGPGGRGGGAGRRMVGTAGRLSAFSFYPTKNLGCLGDGGMVATDDDVLAERVRALRQYGWRERNVSDEPGMNSRLDELQAAVLAVRLPELHGANERRRSIADRYDEALAGGAIAPPQRGGGRHVFHLYVVQAPDREGLARRLRAAGVATAVHYPKPVHRQRAYAGRVATGPAACAATDAAAPRILSLPMYPQLSDAQVDHVCATLRDCARPARAGAA